MHVFNEISNFNFRLLTPSEYEANKDLIAQKRLWLKPDNYENIKSPDDIPVVRRGEVSKYSEYINSQMLDIVLCVDLDNSDTINMKRDDLVLVSGAPYIYNGQGLIISADTKMKCRHHPGISEKAYDNSEIKKAINTYKASMSLPIIYAKKEDLSEYFIPSYELMKNNEATIIRDGRTYWTAHKYGNRYYGGYIGSESGVYATTNPDDVHDLRPCVYVNEKLNAQQGQKIMYQHGDKYTAFTCITNEIAIRDEPVKKDVTLKETDLIPQDMRDKTGTRHTNSVKHDEKKELSGWKNKYQNSLTAELSAQDGLGGKYEQVQGDLTDKADKAEHVCDIANIIKHINNGVLSFKDLPENLRADKEIALAAVTMDGLNLEFVEDSLKKSKRIVYAALNQNKNAIRCVSDGVAITLINANPFLLKYAHTHISSNERIVKRIIKNNPKALVYVNKHLVNDKDIALEAVKGFGRMFLYVGPDMKHDVDVAYAAVSDNGLLLKYMHDKLRGNKKIALAAVENNASSLKYVRQDLLNDRDIALAAVRKDGALLKSLNKSFKSDIDIVSAAVKNDKHAFRYASKSVTTKLLSKDIKLWYFMKPEFKREKELALIAVAKDGLMLKNMGRLASYRDVVFKAVQQNGMALEYAPCFQNNRTTVISAISQNAEAIKFAGESLIRDRMFLLRAIGTNRNVVEYLNDSLKREVNEKLIPMLSDRNCARQMILENGDLINYISKELQNDKEFMKSLVSERATSILLMRPEFRADRDIVMAAVKQDGSILRFADSQHKKDKSIVIAAVQQDGRALKFAHQELRKNKDVVMAAVKQDGRSLQFASPELKKNKDVVCCAINQNKKATQYADETLLKNMRIQAGKLANEILENITEYEISNVALSEARDILESDACSLPAQQNNLNNEKMCDR